MRNYDGLFEYRACLVGTICVGETHYGAAIDTRGFKDVMALLSAGAIGGTNANTGVLAVKWQEGISITGTATEWADITDEAHAAGSFEFDDLTLEAGSSPLSQDKKYAIVGGTERKRYIRCHASLSGTDSVNLIYTVGVLLGRPSDSLYLTDASTTPTGNTDYSAKA